MLYVITEDTNSARDFWKITFKTFLDDKKYKFIEFNLASNGATVSGNKALNGLVDKAMLQVQPGDSLFIAFDNIGASSRVNHKTGKTIGFDSGDFLLNTQQKCNLKNVNLFISSYYCFEELYLSYDGLYRLYSEDGKNKTLLNALKYVQQNILQGTEYYNRNSKYIQEVIKIKPDANTNKEHFADALLSQVTGEIKHGYFTITKNGHTSGVTRCWTKSCEELYSIKNLGVGSYTCENCKFCMKEKSRYDKLVNLDTNSIHINSTENIVKFMSHFNN